MVTCWSTFSYINIWQNLINEQSVKRRWSVLCPKSAIFVLLAEVLTTDLDSLTFLFPISLQVPAMTGRCHVT